MKFKFPLQKVLEHRKVKENLAQKDFQDAMMLLTKENEILAQMEEDKSAAHNRTGVLAQQGGAQGPAFSQIHDFLRGQEIRLQRQKQKIQEIEKLVESKREILRQSVLEYKIMEKMRENKFEEYRHERLAQDQKENDEQSILRFKAVKE